MTDPGKLLVVAIETTKLHGVNPAEYLYSAIVAADRSVALLPWEFATARDALVATSPTSPPQ